MSKQVNLQNINFFLDKNSFVPSELVPGTITPERLNLLNKQLWIIELWPAPHFLYGEIKLRMQIHSGN